MRTLWDLKYGKIGPGMVILLPGDKGPIELIGNESWILFKKNIPT